MSCRLCGRHHPFMTCDDTRVLVEHNKELRAELEAWKRASQEGHPDPCTLGPLCPYCEIERLRAELEAKGRRIALLEEAIKLIGWAEKKIRCSEGKDWPSVGFELDQFLIRALE